MEAAMVISYYRGYVAAGLAETGCMIAVGLPAHEIEPLLPTHVVVACENSPKSTTISGEREPVLRALEIIRHRWPDALTKELGINIAYHSRESFHLLSLIRWRCEGLLKVIGVQTT